MTVETTFCDVTLCYEKLSYAELKHTGRLSPIKSATKTVPGCQTQSDTIFDRALRSDASP